MRIAATLALVSILGAGQAAANEDKDNDPQHQKGVVCGEIARQAWSVADAMTLNRSQIRESGAARSTEKDRELRKRLDSEWIDAKDQQTAYWANLADIVTVYRSLDCPLEGFGNLLMQLYLPLRRHGDSW